MLNHAQSQVADHRDGALLVLAGAGTGKTRTLTHRFASMVADGISPERILLLTFTRKAAAEMNERAAKLLDNIGQSTDIQNVGGTFHSTAFRWLRRLNITDSAFNIVDDRDCKRLFQLDLIDGEKSLLDSIGMSVKDVLHLNSLSVNLQEDPCEVIAKFFPQASNETKWLSEKVFALRQRKKNGGMLDYDDILEEWLKLLRSSQGQVIRNAYDYVMVDEYQDTSRVQVEILKELVKDHDNIMAVGDDCQSIYSFRGALSAQMRDFVNDFEGAEIVKLEDNYRSSQPILNACNDVISESTEVYPKELQSASSKFGPDPLLVEGKDIQHVVHLLLDKIYNNMHQGIPLDQQAVLFRSSMQALSLEKLLVQERLPYKKYGGIKLTEAAHVRDFMSLISCCFSENLAAWLRVLRLIPGVGEKTAERLAESLSQAKTPKSKIPVKAVDFIEHLLTISETAWADEPSRELISQCLEWYESVIPSNYEDFSNRMLDIKQLSSQLLDAASLSDFAADLLLDQVDPNEDDFESSLILSTIHSAKGKEWEAVYILNVADGAIPVHRLTTNFEEERRLLYVAMTRAKEQLFLFWPAFKGYNSDKPNHLSPFLNVLKRGTSIPEQLAADFQDDSFSGDNIYVYDDF